MQGVAVCDAVTAEVHYVGTGVGVNVEIQFGVENEAVMKLGVGVCNVVTAEVHCVGTEVAVTAERRSYVGIVGVSYLVALCAAEVGEFCVVIAFVWLQRSYDWVFSLQMVAKVAVEAVAVAVILVQDRHVGVDYPQL